MVHIGLDVHQSSTTVFWLDTETGETCGQAYDVGTDELVDRLASVPDPGRCVLEAGSCSLFVSERLRTLGAEVWVVDAFKARRVIEGCFGRLKKTDKIDARGLARVSAMGALDHAAIWLPDSETALLRELTRSRQRAVEQRVRTENHLKKYVGRCGYYYGPKSILTKKAGRWLDDVSLELEEELAVVLESLRRRLAAQTEEVAELSALVSKRGPSHPDFALLKTLPGFADVLAASVAAEIGDLSRFQTAESLRGYSGLVPSVAQSGERLRTGRLTRLGNRYLRRSMVLGAQLFVWDKQTEGLRLRSWHARLARRCGRNPARAALARRLLTIIHAMLRDRTPFEPSRYREVD
jgi:transposase